MLTVKPLILQCADKNKQKNCNCNTGCLHRFRSSCNGPKTSGRPLTTWDSISSTSGGYWGLYQKCSTITCRVSVPGPARRSTNEPTSNPGRPRTSTSSTSPGGLGLLHRHRGFEPHPDRHVRTNAVFARRRLRRKRSAIEDRFGPKGMGFQSDEMPKGRQRTPFWSPSKCTDLYIVCAWCKS